MGTLRKPIQQVSCDVEALADRRRPNETPALIEQVHMDDYSQEAYGNMEGVMAVLYAAGTSFCESVGKMGFTISSKSVVFASCRKIAKGLQALFHRGGIPVEVVTNAEHLGFGRCGQGGSTRATIKKRFAKAARRNARIAWLAKRTKRARHFFKTGTVALASYGSSVAGLCPMLQYKLDAMAVAACGRPGLSPCRTTVVWQELGSIPSVVKLVDMIKDFVAAWQTFSDNEKVMVARAWSSQLWRRRCNTHKPNWWHARDAIGSVMAIIVQASWTPTQPVKWRDASGSELADISSSPVHLSEVLTNLRQSLQQARKRQASSHFCGQGLEQGVPCFHAVTAAKRTIRKHHLAQACGLLDRVVMGGAHVGERCKLNQQCRLCGASCETAAHRYYTCPQLAAAAEATNEFTHHWITKTTWLARVAAGHDYQPSLVSGDSST